MAKISY